jgi:hypothetical protein
VKTKTIYHADGREQTAPCRRIVDRNPPRLTRASGPGSMDCETEIMAMAKGGARYEAHELYVEHLGAVGVRALPWVRKRALRSAYRANREPATA